MNDHMDDPMDDPMDDRVTDPITDRAMQYIEVSVCGKPEVMQVKNGPRPVPADDEILIKVHAAGVNRPDILQRQGLYPPPPGASPVLGLEVSGVVAQTGVKVTGWTVSDKVCALTNGGGYAEYVAVPAGQCLPVPAGLSMVEAAALPETFFTVWINVFERAALKTKESFLVHGGSSGIGTTAIQMAHSMGAKVFATAGSDDKCEACRKLGADVVVNYRQKNFVDVLKDATNGNGVDVILDMVGGDYVGRNLELAAMDGRVTSIAFLNGAKVEVDLMPVLLKRLVLTGSTLRPRSTAFKAKMAEKLKTLIWPLIENKTIAPLVYAQFPLIDVIAAHQLMESGRHIGKIILTMAV